MVRKRSTSSDRPIWRSISLSGGRRRVDVHQRVIRLAVLLDPVGEGLQAPVLDPANLAAACRDDALETFNELIDLLLRQILPGKKYMFVKSHFLPFFILSPAPKAKPLRLCLILRWPDGRL
jgi:hypothetical protein